MYTVYQVNYCNLSIFFNLCKCIHPHKIVFIISFLENIFKKSHFEKRLEKIRLHESFWFFRETRWMKGG